ncbi:unnamed protein product [Caenorhabditis angaria]|uniref:7TM GPCR serpentine receptor class x (Srx) domain-containing protein n=1 Tax=Caenorhabditis angaria TaxID=860376 RepID=A0A9P1IKN1_9PELO|nr:unnamed protein product [Caenorhabditis angaria]
MNITLDFVGIGEIDFPVYTDEEYYGREVPYAIFIAVYTTLAIILQILVIRVFTTEREMKKLPAFQIMLMISIFDTIQLFIHLYAVFYILSSEPHFAMWDFIIGAVMNASWVVMLLLSILLNFNRVFSIVFHFQANAIFSKTMMKVYLFITCLLWCFLASLNISGLSRMVYLLPAYTWHYLAENPLSEIVRTGSADASLIDVVFSLISHIIIFSWIYLKAAILSKKELILTIQVLCISIFHVIGYVTWEYLPIPWELPIGVFLGHVVWMVWNSINPILYILINPRIRMGVLGQFGIGPGVQNITQVSAIRSTVSAIQNSPRV